LTIDLIASTTYFLTMSKSLLRATALLALAGMATAIDIELDKVTCDAGLPIYAANNGIRMLCGGGKRCTFGEEAVIDGLRKSADLMNDYIFVEVDHALTSLLFLFPQSFMKESKMLAFTTPLPMQRLS
jgi:hypothetical protein